MPHFHHFSISNQNKPTSILVIFRQNTKAIALLFGQNCLIFITFQSPIIFRQNKPTSILVIFRQNTKAIALLFGQNCLRHFHHFSISNQNKPTSSSVIFRQNTKAIALLFGQKCLIFITFQSPIKISQLQFWSFFGKILRL